MTDDVFESLAAALKDSFQTPWGELPERLRERIKRDLFGVDWDKLSEERRKALAEQWDYENDPTAAAERTRDLAMWEEYHEAKREVAKWEAVAAPTALDQAMRDDRLKEAKRRLAPLTDPYNRMRGDYGGQGESRATDQTETGTGAETESRMDQMATEIDQAIREIDGDYTRYQVMRKLQSYAAKPGSCITDAGPNFVLWRSASGEIKKLDWKNLGLRLARLRANAR